jgi:hypothetical protein
MTAIPEFIIVETDLDQFIIARLESAEPPLYRKLLAAVGRPSAELAHTALSRDARISQTATARIVRDSSVEINERGEGVIRGRISPEGLLADEPVEDD